MAAAASTTNCRMVAERSAHCGVLKRAARDTSMQNCRVSAVYSKAGALERTWSDASAPCVMKTATHTHAAHTSRWSASRRATATLKQDASILPT